MKIRYERQIRKFARQAVERDLLARLKPHLDRLAPEIESAIELEVANYPVRERYGAGTVENLCSRLREIGESVADQLRATVFRRAIPHVERDLDQKEEALTRRHARANGIESALAALREDVSHGRVDRCGPYWDGADVTVSPVPPSAEELMIRFMEYWMFDKHVDVVTGDEALAGSLTWIFSRLGQIVSPLVESWSDECEFYGDLARDALDAIDSPAGDERAVLDTVIASAERYWENRRPLFADSHVQQIGLIEEARAWLAEAKNAPPTAPKPPSNPAGSPSWERFRPGASGRCALRTVGDDAILSGDYERGTVTTGKSEVFWGYYVSIRTEAKEIVGKSQGYTGTYRYALDDCNRKLALDGLILLAAGNAEGYSESALSGPAGFGYLEGRPEAVDILSRVEP